MIIHKFLKDSGDSSCKAPRDVSTKILACLPPSDVFAKTEVAGPGFINAYLNPAWVASQFAQVVKSRPAPLLLDM